MTLKTPVGVGWLAVPVETGAWATRTPSRYSERRWLPIEMAIWRTPLFGTSANPSFSGLGFLTAPTAVAVLSTDFDRLRMAASAEVAMPATNARATLATSARRKALVPGPPQADKTGAPPISSAKTLSQCFLG